MEELEKIKPPIPEPKKPEEAIPEVKETAEQTAFKDETMRFAAIEVYRWLHEVKTIGILSIIAIFMIELLHVWNQIFGAIAAVIAVGVIAWQMRLAVVEMKRLGNKYNIDFKSVKGVGSQ